MRVIIHMSTCIQCLGITSLMVPEQDLRHARQTKTHFTKAITANLLILEYAMIELQ